MPQENGPFPYSISKAVGKTVLDSKPVIRFWPPGFGTKNNALLAALAEIFPVRFLEFHTQDASNRSALIACGMHRESRQLWKEEGSDCLLIEHEGKVGPVIGDFEVEFANSEILEPVLKDRRLPHGPLLSVATLGTCLGEDVLAHSAGKPLWVASQVGGATKHRVALPLPEIEPGKLLVREFRRMNFLRLLPLVCFIRRVCAKAGWHFPPTRAALMLDDPNLHWWTYGCFDFRKLLSHAQQHGYHMAIATVPIDQWWVHPEVGRLFRENPRHLSLLIHGVRHISGELATAASEDDALRLLAHGLRHVHRMESRIGLQVTRSVAPPHGKCTLKTFSAMARLGIEACVNSCGSVSGNVPLDQLSASFGMAPASFPAGGCTVLDRFRLASDCDFEILRACLVNQPIIAVGHHTDLKGGFGILASVAGKINSSGPVQWMDMADLVRSNFASLQRDETLWVLVYSRSVEFRRPPKVTRLVVLRSWIRENGAEPIQIQIAGHSIRLDGGASTEVELPDSNGEEIITIMSPHRFPVDPSTVPHLKPALWPLLRRAICEGRDRMIGSFHRHF